ncbi:MAG: DUF4445 domain-containing protein, partial [Hyphomicrobiales bacterium]|nr:DUF4445 domain-containing protein [Hyphomicrobiales bacterium]
MSEFTIAFSPSGKRGRFREGVSVLEAARKLGVDLDSVCGGRGICGRCRVSIVEGVDQKRAIASTLDHVTQMGAVEERYQRVRRPFARGERLGCQARLRGDLIVDVPAESQLHRQVVRKRAEAWPVKIDPVSRLYYLEVEKPDMTDPSSDFRRLAKALAEQWGLPEVRAELSVLRGLQKTLRAADFAVTACVRHGRDIVAIYPGLKERVFGLAFDIGSTTVAAHLCDLGSGDVLASSGRMNPQIRLGEDLMSRVSHIMMHPGGDLELTKAVHEALGGLAKETAQQSGIAPSDIVEVTLAGNPIMHHLALGLDPTELGVAPFALTIDAGFDVPAREIGLDIAPGAFAYALPCIGGHVGADAAAVVLCEAPYLSDEVRLIVDVGTNAEIVLGNRSRLLACSSPTGPAFEGAQISCGQRAAPGAIERLRIDKATLEPRFKVVGCDLWSDEEGFAEEVAGTGVTGICGSGIIEAVAEMMIAGVLRPDGIIDGAMAERTARIEAEGRTFAYVIAKGEPRIAITQADIRAIQLAKAALYAGVKLLMDRYGVTKVDRITLAGAFGSHVDALYAMALGLIPDCVLENVSSAGNAAGTGARIALLNAASRREIGEVVRRIEKVETAIEPAFQAHFVEAMAIPHASDTFPHLEEKLGIRLQRQVVAEPRR